jgi:hypothetical protein
VQNYNKKESLNFSDRKTIIKGSIGIAVIPARYGGVKRDKIKDKNGKPHGKSRNHDTA